MRYFLILLALAGCWLTASTQAAETIALEASAAHIAGTARYETTTRNVGYWNSAATRVSWTTQVAVAGTYRVHVVYACQDKSAGAVYDVNVGSQRANGTVRATGKDWQTYVEEDLGPVLLRKPGPITVEVAPQSKPGQAVMNLRRIVLIRENP